MIKINFNQYIEKNIIRCEAGYRGGGIEIKLWPLLPGLDNPRMTAYQNYLGGGLLGRISNSYNFDIEELNQEQADLIERMSDALNRYFHDLTNHSDDEWEAESYEDNQLRKPVSAY